MQTEVQEEIIWWSITSQNTTRTQKVKTKGFQKNWWMNLVCSLTTKEMSLAWPEWAEKLKIKKKWRPLIVNFYSYTTKNMILERCFKLKRLQKFKSLIISHDLSRDDREQCRILIKKAKEEKEKKWWGWKVYLQSERRAWIFSCSPGQKTKFITLKELKRKNWK